MRTESPRVKWPAPNHTVNKQSWDSGVESLS